MLFQLASSAHILPEAPSQALSEQVSFPKLGNVQLITESHSKQLPTIVFKSKNYPREIARLKVGSGIFDPKSISEADPYPIIRFRTLRFAAIATPIIFVAAMDAGGSDCTYAALVAGERDGKIVSLSPPLPMVNAEGGYSIQRKEASVDLFAWNFIWGPNESHVDPHDYWVRVYRWNAGRFVFLSRYIVKKTEPDIAYPNLLRDLKDFEC